MARKAVAAWRTSLRAVRLEGGTSPPRPKASAAAASRSMARTWLRMNRMATAVSSTVATVSQRTKMWPWVAKARSRGRDDAQHPARHLHPDVDVGRVAGGVEPEGLVEAVGQRLLQRPVDGDEQRWRVGRAGRLRPGCRATDRSSDLLGALGELARRPAGSGSSSIALAPPRRRRRPGPRTGGWSPSASGRRRRPRSPRSASSPPAGR